MNVKKRALAGRGIIRDEAMMPSTHLSLHYHVVFSTIERRPVISPEWQEVECHRKNLSASSVAIAA
jgi:hypothetical protein